MIAVNQYTWTMLFFYIIEEAMIYENDCYYLIKDTKQFLLISINQYVEIRPILKYRITPHTPKTSNYIKKI